MIGNNAEHSSLPTISTLSNTKRSARLLRGVQARPGQEARMLPGIVPDTPIVPAAMALMVTARHITNPGVQLYKALTTSIRITNPRDLNLPHNGGRMYIKRVPTIYR